MDATFALPKKVERDVGDLGWGRGWGTSQSLSYKSAQA